MFKIIYKYLFEVQILHEYYMATNDSDSLFSLSSQELNSITNTRISQNKFNIWNDIAIAPTAETARILEKYHMVFKRTATGFFIGIEVLQKQNNSGNIDFYPFIEISKALELNFEMRIVNADFKNISNFRLRRIFTSTYFFNNYLDLNSKAFPALSLPVNEYNSSKTYEMGELATIGGTLKQALRNTDNPFSQNWQEIDDVGIVNEADSILLPHVFTYTFPVGSVGTSASFTLKQLDGTTVKNLSFSGSHPLKDAQLDFRHTNNITGDAIIKNGIYQLDITSASGSTTTRKVILNDKLYNMSSLGIISINTGVNTPFFQILKSDGSIDASRNNADGTTHPKFEIRFKNRMTYWRYRSTQNKKLEVTPVSNNFLEESGKNLHTRSAMPMRALPSEFIYTDTATGQEESVYLPGPANPSFILDVDGRVFSEIYTSKIDGLIKEN